MDIQTAFGLPPVKVTIQITADKIDLGIDLFLTKDPATGKLVSTAKNTTLQFTNLKALPINGPLSNVINPVLGQIESAILAPLTNLLTGILGPTLITTIGGALGNALGALAINTTIPLGPFIGKGAPANLKLTSDIGTLSFQAKQGIVFGLAASMTADKKVPIEVFFRKVIGLRDKLRLLEQKVNSHPKLTQEDKVQLQQYVTQCYGALTTFNLLFADREDGFVGQSSDD